MYNLPMDNSFFEDLNEVINEFKKQFGGESKKQGGGNMEKDIMGKLLLPAVLVVAVMLAFSAFFIVPPG